MFRRIAIATLALAVGVAASAGLLVYAKSVAGARSVLAVTRDLPAGASLTAELLAPVQAAVDPAQAAVLVEASERARVIGGHAEHPLARSWELKRSTCSMP